MNKKALIISVIILIIAIIIIVLFLLLKPFSSTNSNEWTFEKHGWINCQPVLDKKRAKLCKEAEEAGYEYIAY